MDAKKLAVILDVLMQKDGDSKSSGVASALIGKYVIVRSRNEGINAGEVIDADETGIILKNARRLWSHIPASAKECWYEGVANHGLAEGSKVSGVTMEKTIIESYSATLCSDTARSSIEGMKPHEQS